MVTVTNHGGGCCGILHLWDFDYYGPTNEEAAIKHIKERLDTKIKTAYEDAWGLDGDWSCLVEAVLITQQLDNGWRPVLEKMGFKEVNSFRNSNSSNTCHVLHLKTQEIK